MSVDLVKAEPVKSESPRIEKWWPRQWRYRLEIPAPARRFLFVAGVLFELSSDSSTLQLAYSIADKSLPWFSVYGIVVNGSTIGWLARGLGFDITKSILLPIGLQAFSKDIIVRSIPVMLGGFLALSVSVFATMGIMQSHATWETQKSAADNDYREAHNRTLSEIDNQIRSANSNARAIENTSNALLDADRPRSAANIVGNMTQITKVNTTLLLKKLDAEKPIEPEKNGQLTGTYNSVMALFGMHESKSKSAFDLLVSFSEEFLGVLCLTLSATFVRKDFAGRKDDAKGDQGDGTDSVHEVEPQATVAAAREELSLVAPEPPAPVQSGPNAIQSMIEKLTQKEEDLIGSAIHMIKNGRLANLSHDNLQKQLSCGSDASTFIRKELIKRKYAFERGRRLMVNPKKVEERK